MELPQKYVVDNFAVDMPSVQAIAIRLRLPPACAGANIVACRFPQDRVVRGWCLSPRLVRPRQRRLGRDEVRLQQGTKRGRSGEPDRALTLFTVLVPRVTLAAERAVVLVDGRAREEEAVRGRCMGAMSPPRIVAIIQKEREFELVFEPISFLK